MRTHVYLDNNATTPLDSQVAAAMWQCSRDFIANPSSQHQLGQQARKTLDDAKETILTQLGAAPTSRLIVTSGGTEANNLAIFGVVARRRGKVLISSIEHTSISGVAAELVRRGFEVETIAVDRQGRILEEDLQSKLTSRVALVSVMLVNNETGSIQPIQAIAKRCRELDIVLHTDAVQAVGKIPFGFDDLNVDALTFSAHKLHGPLGVGGLIVREGLEISPILFGGFQQFGFRPGTESLPLVVGARTAIELYGNDALSIRTHLTALRDGFEARLLAELPDIVIHSRDTLRAPHTSNISFVGLDRQSLLMALDMAGVACSTGSACASGSSEPSPVLQAMGAPNEQLQSALRFSFSRLTTAEEASLGADRIIETCKVLRRSQRRRKVASIPPHNTAKRL